MTGILIFLIGLLIPASRPCLETLAPERRDIATSWHSGVVTACLKSLPALEGKIKFANFFLRRPELAVTADIISEIKPLLPHSDYFFGNDRPISYLVLLQNNHEMRANGGFFGSYAVATVDKSRAVFRFQDIYVPDGAIPGHVEPPAPIQTAFKQGWFRLRDADWEPDWPTAAKTIRWFLVKGNEIDPDVLVTLNLSTIEKIIGIIGEINLPEYNLRLTAENLYALLQNEAEIGFFPGSTQKRDALNTVGRAVTQKLSSLSPKQYLDIGNILIETAGRQNLLLNSANQEIQKLFEEKNWAGKLTPAGCDSPHTRQVCDTVLLVETNLGANKANCCVERNSVHTVAKTETDISHLINLTFTNNSPLENPLPPRFFGGNYISYLRYYLPENARNIRLTAQPTLPKTLSQYPPPFDGLKQTTFDRRFAYGLTEIGFFHTTAAGSKSAIQLSYDLPLDNLGGYPISDYQLNLLKQNGLESSPAEINLFGKTVSTDLRSDYFISSAIN